MKRNAYIITLTLLAVLISVPAFAQAALKIAVVDTDKTFKESIWGKKVLAELEKELEKWQDKGDQLDKEIAALEEKLATQSGFLDDKEAEQNLKNEINSKKMQGQALVQQGNAVLADKRESLLEPISEEIKNLIKKLAMDEDYDLILEKQLFVLYLNPELDITSRIVVMLDEVYQGRSSKKARESDKPSPEQSEEEVTE